MTALTPTLLLILDGWGIAPESEGNAVTMASTPNLDRLCADFPRTELTCSGRAVGLPDGFMGNSEVGHMNIGAGRVVYQDMTRIDLAIENNELASNVVLKELMDTAKAGGGRLHLMGLVSDGGVHSHILHLFALLEAAKAAGVETFIHVFLDGRDTAPTSGAGFVRQLQARLDELGFGRIATVTGRYWAMDRDKRWERNKDAYDALTLGKGVMVTDAVSAIEAAYGAGENDEFVKPRVLMDGEVPVGLLRDGDAAFFFNFRADRARQIVRSLFDEEFAEFEREACPKLHLGTMTRYEASFPLPVAFPPQTISETLGEVVSGLGAKQLRIAETEKYAHVTYFMNCGREEPFENEERVLIQSPRDVATYDEKPEMSVKEVTQKLLAALGSGHYSFIACNFANLDMVGHTGIIPAVLEAAKNVDECVGQVVNLALASGFRVMITADHGNAEQMISDDGGPHTAHSTNKVPFVLVDKNRTEVSLRSGGILGDIAPTVLSLWGIDAPVAMTGQTLVED
ncbi:2,3-bisphosphoglycerate-independent phosphoglycerate mutase [Desulfovibrio ferrophilus]|uniref:2,3-bisphosphoglycerate-independent phosphoglycerate mutase n=1 Tax=Desulfovibrio ferrophilus TaxID=241368 RepID=A0A2Z6AXD2_9BACT|nr:2,3-bisphosphoglycerate-independent phosphoglycerate mutase [Desulfovibrio ferrophilus]BBD07853.1 2,3-bisphosphoglycerate-independentphosphoglycerate mutase [Desulfovibrio ferrophilus]